MKKQLKSLEIKQTFFEENHPAIASSYYCLGIIYDKQKNTAEAMKYHLKSLKIRMSVYDNKHPKESDSCRAVGFLYEQHRYRLHARKYFLKAYDIKKSIYGKGHASLQYIYEDVDEIDQMTAKYSRNNAFDPY